QRPPAAPGAAQRQTLRAKPTLLSDPKSPIPTAKFRQGLPSFAQNLLHGPALGELVDELIQVADLPHGFVLDFFHPNAADNACNQARVRMEARCLRIEGLQVDVRVDDLFQACRLVPGEPED